MRRLIALLIGTVCASGAPAQQPKDTKPDKRYGIEADLLTYPQAEPKETLASVIKAIDGGRINYLLAQLADPDWVDQRVKQIHGGKFDAMVDETTTKLSSDRTTIKELRRFLNEGNWETTGDTASAQVKDIKNRRVYLRKIGRHWFFETQQEPRAAKEK
jgi:hypothetical protein